MTKDQFLKDVAENELCLSYSSIMALLKSPRHFFERAIKKEMPPTPAMLFGSMFHCLVLEPNDFHQRYAVSPDFDKRTKAGKEALSNFMSENIGKDIVSLSDYNLALDMQKAVLDSPILAPLMQGEKEQVFYTEYDGIKIRGYRDVYSEAFGTTDLKTAQDANPKNFKRKAVYDFMYHLQAAIYTLNNDISYTIVAVDKNCFTSLMSFSDSALSKGKTLLAKGVYHYKELQEETMKGNTDVWLQGYEYWYPFGYQIDL